MYATRSLKYKDTNVTFQIKQKFTLIVQIVRKHSDCLCGRDKHGPGIGFKSYAFWFFDEFGLDFIISA